mgnify:CR=1 FL=1
MSEEGDGLPAVAKSKYNAGVYKIQRLHESWGVIRTAWRNADYQTLNSELEIIWQELEADSTNIQQRTVQLLNKDYRSAVKNKNVAGMFKWLRHKWTFLLRIEKAQGLGKIYYDDMEDALT